MMESYDNTSAQRGAYYCHFTPGHGHPTRSLNINRSLIAKFEVDFLMSGSALKLPIHSPSFKQIALPPYGSLTPCAGDGQPWHKGQPYDFLITENFPFSRHECKTQFEEVIRSIKKTNPDCLVICSLKDSFPPSTSESDRQTLEIINAHFDAIFVHSDPRLFLLEESYSLAKAVQEKVVYTGFIDNSHKEISECEREKRIVVSTGYGRFGEELIYASLNTASYLPEYKFVIILGPQLPAKVADEVKFTALKLGAENIAVQPLINNFQEFLSESALSISLGGATILDVVKTKTPAIVLPSTFHDQHVRASKFSALGFLKMISKDDLTPERLCQAIEETLKMGPPAFVVDMNGARATCDEIEKMLLKPANSLTRRA